MDFDFVTLGVTINCLVHWLYHKNQQVLNTLILQGPLNNNSIQQLKYLPRHGRTISNIGGIASFFIKNRGLIVLKN